MTTALARMHDKCQRLEERLDALLKRVRDLEAQRAELTRQVEMYSQLSTLQILATHPSPAAVAEAEPLPLTLTIEETARHLRVSVPMVRKLISEERLPSFHLGAAHRCRVESLAKWLEEREAKSMEQRWGVDWPPKPKPREDPAPRKRR